MSEPLTPELEQKAQELAQRIQVRSASAILDIARRLVATTDETLFGDTEFAIRDHALGLVGSAYTEHIKKKVGTSGPVSTVPTAGVLPRSTITGRKRSKRSAGQSPATEPTTTAAPVEKAPTPGMPGSD